MSTTSKTACFETLNLKLYNRNLNTGNTKPTITNNSQPQVNLISYEKNVNPLTPNEPYMKAYTDIYVNTQPFLFNPLAYTNTCQAF